jgi:hypothetical protein
VPGESAREFWERRGISVYDTVYLLATPFVIVVSYLVAPINESLGFEVPEEIFYTNFALPYPGREACERTATRPIHTSTQRTSRCQYS